MPSENGFPANRPFATADVATSAPAASASAAISGPAPRPPRPATKTGRAAVWMAFASRAADAASGRTKAAKCTVCHGLDGIAKNPNAPNLAGESTIYIRKQLSAFRSGERKDPQMSLMAKNLSDEDIADLAAWYSSLKVTVEMPK